jgi:hypothetical protein
VNRKRPDRKWSKPILRNYPLILLERLKKTMQTAWTGDNRPEIEIGYTLNTVAVP